AKATAPATRSSTRTKTPVPPPDPSGIKAKRTTTQADTSKAKTTGTSRKPLVNRANSQPLASKMPAIGLPRVTKAALAEQEPIVAYLRIRPHVGDDGPATMPYLEPLSDAAVRMTDPNGDGRGSSRPQFRVSTAAPSSIYKFSHVFPPSTQQAVFFTKTTLPLVQALLNGQNGLLFAYGVTNSGKTYTIQGGHEPGSAGILPRTLDVVFNSVEGLHNDGHYRPVRLHGVERVDPSDSNLPSVDIDVPSETALAEVLAEHLVTSNGTDVDNDQTVIKLDRNYEYSIWLSYAEVYNEKVYDLLDSVHDEQGKETSMPHTNSNLLGQSAHPLLVTRKALTIKSSPASDAVDETGLGSAGKYISGLRQFRVTSAAQAKSLVKLGQLHRRVFGTLANSQSSRSHSMIIIKVLRHHRGERDDPASVQISRLTLVDLAGSERTKHTQTTGDRLKEAGNINKSLMVLGQCMEVMRANQKRLAQSLANPGRTDTRDVKRTLAVVPFRHSKLTEVLMDYFAGDGKVAMIVNVNPYDTGFDENSHVMKFSALAREVSTVVNNAPVPRVQGSPTKRSAATKPVPTGLPRPVTRKVTILSSGVGKRVSEAHLEVLEEDEDGDDHSDDEPINPLVDALFDEIEDLRLRLYEAEMRCTIVEAETREEVMKEMEERMRVVERTYAHRLMCEVERNEEKLDAKIDMLHQAGWLGTATKGGVSASESDTDHSDDVSNSVDFSDEGRMDEAPSSSPLQGKSRSPAAANIMSTYSRLSNDSDGMVGNPVAEQGAGEEDTSEPSFGEDDEDDYVPPIPAPVTKARHVNVSPNPYAFEVMHSVQRSSKHTTLQLEQQMAGMLISDDVTPGADDSAVILPNRKAQQAAAGTGGPGVEYVPGKGEVDVVKKKKR
ncbi:kinesin-domain-containing protein, partial [Phlebopus sp. FC_14]